MIDPDADVCLQCVVVSNLDFTLLRCLDQIQFPVGKQLHCGLTEPFTLLASGWFLPRQLLFWCLMFEFQTEGEMSNKAFESWQADSST
jgi:hypothetical protein